MSLFSQLTEKPWVATDGPAEDLVEGRMSSMPTARFGLRFVLIAVTIVFSALVIVYTERMAFSDWRPMPETWLLWLNTAVLMLSSVALQRASTCARRGDRIGVRTGVFAGGGLAFAFLIGQLAAWQQLASLGYYADSNPANAFFYLITAMHGVHMLGGLIGWSRTALRVQRDADAARVRLSVELCTVYWHFLLMVWLIVFGLMLFT